MRKTSCKEKIIIKVENKNTINLRKFEYIYKNVLKVYNINPNDITLEFLKDSIILKRYLLYLSKNKDIVSKITVLSVENIRKDIERIIEYEKEILRLKHQIDNPQATLLLTNLEYKSQVNIDFDIRYLLYIKKYGCPEDGIFIDDLLNEIDVSDLC